MSREHEHGVANHPTTLWHLGAFQLSQAGGHKAQSGVSPPLAWALFLLVPGFMRPDELLVILRKTQALIADARRWTGCNFAEDEAGRWVPVGSERAVKFNLAGALIKSAGTMSRQATHAFTELLTRAARPVDSLMLSGPDQRLHSQALEVLAVAIEQLEMSTAEQRS